MTADPIVVRRRLLAALLALFVLVVVGRFAFVSVYAASIPYWDQWDAEGAHLIKPWLDGTLTVGHMFAPHNEHRILFTRLVSLALLEANDQQWDSLPGVYANVFIYAAIPALLFAVFAPGLRTRVAKWTLFLVLLALAWLPYGQHNTLVAFQNQFFFMSLFAIACIWLAARARDDAWLPAKVLPAAVFGLFTMASGLFGAVAAGGVLTLRLAVLRNLRPLRACVTIALLAAIAVTSYLAIPHISGLEWMKAQDAATWLQRFVFHLGWPLAGDSWFAWIPIWAPSVIAAYRLLRHREADARDLCALGLGAWTVMQVAAIAYARDVLSDRYFDTLALGLVANLCLALRLFERYNFVATSAPLQRVASAAPLALLLLAWATGLGRSFNEDVQAAARRSTLSTLQTANVRQFVATGDRSALDDRMRLHIPYPSADRLAGLLLDPTLRGTLPAIVRTQAERGGLSTVAVRLQDHVRGLFGLPPRATLQGGLHFVESPTSRPRATPLQLPPRKLAQIKWTAPRSGALATVSTMIGNYAHQSDGLLAVQACSARECRSAHAWLQDSADGLFFGARFDRPLDVEAGEPLVFKFWTHRSTHPVAIFGYPATARSPRIVYFADIAPGALAGRTARLRLGFRQ